MTELPAVVHDSAARRFEIVMGDAVAFADYSLGEGTITLPHTVAPEAFKGLGAGRALAEAALAYARQHELQVLPTCSFMAAYIAKRPEWRDIVHPKFRDGLGV